MNKNICFIKTPMNCKLKSITAKLFKSMFYNILCYFKESPTGYSRIEMINDHHSDLTSYDNLLSIIVRCDDSCEVNKILGKVLGTSLNLKIPNESLKI